MFLLNFNDDESNEDLRYRIGRRVVNLLLYFLVWAIGRRFKRCLVYWMPVVFIFTRFTSTLAASAAIKSTDDSEIQLTMIGSEMNSTILDMAVFIIVLTPSLSFIVFIYWPACAGYMVYYKLEYGFDH